MNTYYALSSGERAAVQDPRKMISALRKQFTKLDGKFCDEEGGSVLRRGRESAGLLGKGAREEREWV